MISVGVNLFEEDDVTAPGPEDIFLGQEDGSLLLQEDLSPILVET